MIPHQRLRRSITQNSTYNSVKIIMTSIVLVLIAWELFLWLSRR